MGNDVDGVVVDAVTARPCRCGHDRDVHEHFRTGTDCATCGCTRFRRPGRFSGR